MITDIFDMDAFERFTERAYQHYIKTAPPVADYLDDICDKLTDNDNWRGITIYEVCSICRLEEEGEWMEASMAINYLLHTLDKIGADTSHIYEG